MSALQESFEQWASGRLLSIEKTMSVTPFTYVSQETETAYLAWVAGIRFQQKQAKEYARQRRNKRNGPPHVKAL